METRELLIWQAEDNVKKTSDKTEEDMAVEIKKAAINSVYLQWAMSLALYLVVTTSYYWCEYLTWKWSNGERFWWNSSRYSLFVYPVFWFVMNVFRFIAKRVARYLDKNKANSFVSVEICMEFLLSCFYYVFYRNLFLHVSSIKSFVIMKLCHVLLEFLQCPCRMTRLYFDTTHSFQTWLMAYFNATDSKSSFSSTRLSLGTTVVKMLYDPCLYQMWCVRLSVDYTLRYIISIASGIAFLIGLCWAEYGYNKEFFPLDVNNEQFQKTLWFVLIGVIIEVWLYLFIDWLCIRTLRMEMLRYWSALVYHRPQYLLFMVVAAQHVMTDVIVAKLQIS
ncbi:hypothetical protein RFI_11299 [Reticulomyxa filosa]|uniref:Uncharacterized protein n=1 Tax=Reticulomyxa filosa TaxID=46433 RepID=X6NHN8_RETFI|nr:hypothetical protein RFI_11299 [Reticulomyxa filosa]|eukprot:ETO25840.1 hypothetical protein RFI_11299 [Reticulomyxa filosa]